MIQNLLMEKHITMQACASRNIAQNIIYRLLTAQACGLDEGKLLGLLRAITASSTTKTRGKSAGTSGMVSVSADELVSIIVQLAGNALAMRGKGEAQPVPIKRIPISSRY